VQFRVPVDQAFAAVNQVIFIQADEYFLHCVRQAFVHSETFFVPVDRVTQTAHLRSDSATGFGFPFPDFFDEGIAAHGVTIRQAGGSQFTLDHHLGGNTGVVGTDLPQRVFALHAFVAGQGGGGIMMQ